MLAAHEIFAFISAGLATEIVEQLHNSDKATYRSILNSVAEARHVRPVFLERKPRSERNRAMVESLGRLHLETVAITTLQTWLMKNQTAMLTDFLDALAIKHEKGAVEDLPKSIEDDKLRAAMEGLLAKHPREKVAVYLRAFNDLSQANWPNLASLLESEPRLQLGA